MKNTLLSTLCFSLFFLASCKKNEQQVVSSIKADTKKYAVNFNLSDFQQSTSAISNSKGASVSATDSLKNHINNLIYLAYNADGKEVGRIRQYSQDYNSYQAVYNNFQIDDFKPYSKPFGSITDSLPAGNYTIVMVGSNYRFAINDRIQNDPSVGLDEARLLDKALVSEENGLSYIFSKTEDTFYKKLSVTVASENVNQSAELDRLTGKLQIQITDAIPANAYRFEFKIYHAPHYILLNGPTVEGDTYYDDEEVTGENLETYQFHPIDIKASEIGMINYQYTKFLYGRDTPVIVKLRCFDASGNIIATKKVTGVYIYKNKRTILKGKLFGNTSEAGFSVSVNDTWDPIPVELPF